MPAGSSKAPEALSGVAPLSARYDGFILDLWGVIHDGVTAYPGAASCLAALKAAQKPVVLLTNAPRPAQVVSTLMDGMGIPEDLYKGIITSGDAVNLELAQRKNPEFAALGSKVCLVGPERDYGTLDGLPMTKVDSPEEADWVLMTGPVDLSDTVEKYVPLMARMRAKDLPMVCANPDQYVIREGKKVMCAGLLAQSYSAMGGTVINRGKPDPAVYYLALEMLDLGPEAKVAVIGDGLHTDMPGAEASGLDGILVTGGLNAQPLGIRHGEKADPAKVATLMAKHGLSPVAMIPAFVW